MSTRVALRTAAPGGKTAPRAARAARATRADTLTTFTSPAA
jgi:hypothetical protein